MKRISCVAVAVGTELLGQIIDTNSSWIGEHQYQASIVSTNKSGDNPALNQKRPRQAIDHLTLSSYAEV